MKQRLYSSIFFLLTITIPALGMVSLELDNLSQKERISLPSQSKSPTLHDQKHWTIFRDRMKNAGENHDLGKLKAVIIVLSKNVRYFDVSTCDLYLELIRELHKNHEQPLQPLEAEFKAFQDSLDAAVNYQTTKAPEGGAQLNAEDAEGSQRSESQSHTGAANFAISGDTSSWIIKMRQKYVYAHEQVSLSNAEKNSLENESKRLAEMALKTTRQRVNNKETATPGDPLTTSREIITCPSPCSIS